MSNVISQKKLFLTLLLIGLALVLAAWWNQYSNSKDKGGCRNCNLILIAATNVSANHMSLYGYEKLTTPLIDEFSKQAVVLDKMYTHTSWTLPTAVSAYTSQFPYAHTITNRRNTSGIRQSTLAQILADEGYHTAAFTGGGDYKAIYGLHKGFETYVDTSEFVSIEERLPLVYDWLETNGEDKFFMLLQGFKTHCPFNPSPKYRSADLIALEKNIIDPTAKKNFCLRGFEESNAPGIYQTYFFQQGETKPVLLNEVDVEYLTALYDAEIKEEDAAVGELLEYLEQEGYVQNSVIVVFSEHGEMFVHDGRFGRAGINRGSFGDDVLHVPFIMSIPGVSPKRLPQLSQIVDLLPTILDVLGVAHPNPSIMQGKSFFSSIYESNLVSDRSVDNKYVFAGSEFGASQFEYYPDLSRMSSVQNDTHRLVHEVFLDSSQVFESERWGLYEIGSSTNKEVNIYDGSLPVVSELKVALRDWLINMEVELTPELKEMKLPDDVIEAANQHGYW